MAKGLTYEYLLKIDGNETIDDSFDSDFDMELIAGEGFVWKDEYYKIIKIESFVYAKKNIKVHIVDLIHVKFDLVPSVVRTRMLWNK